MRIKLADYSIKASLHTITKDFETPFEVPYGMREEHSFRIVIDRETTDVCKHIDDGF